MGLQEALHRRAAGRRGEHRENPRPPAADRRRNPPPRAGRSRRGQRLEGAPAAARGRRQRPHRPAVPHRGAGRLLCRDRGPRHGHQRLQGDDPHPDRAGRGRGHRLRGRTAFLHPQDCRRPHQTAHERNRADLQPLLQLAGLHESKGQAAEARALYTDILADEPDWPEALHAAFWFHVDQGDIARVRTTLADAGATTKKPTAWPSVSPPLTPATPNGSATSRCPTTRLGDVAVAQGKLEEAARAYGDGLGIAKEACGE